ncbi:hypothetical protein [Cellulomonas hominis]|uniref:hypothetical protein n=1 Tax=Cellulomonas hominis TaxID=156981 RepID=UPI001B99DA4C|nr:hypothetical protein [Cellulomonas hominis]VTR76058.1 hypothetical protein CHMI_00814 [Cellulomonas hominis]
MAHDTAHRLPDTRARERAALLARRRRARTRLPLDVALRLAMDPAMDPRRGRAAR